MVIAKSAHSSFTYAMLLTMSEGICMANCTQGNAEDLFSSTILSIDHRFRPTVNLSEPTIVSLSLILVSLVDVDEVQQRMASNVLMTVSWLDELRQWNSSQYGGLTKVHPDPLDVWRPRIFLTNSLVQRDVFEDNYAPLTIYNTGETEWLPGGILYSQCSMQMTYYPFDIQTCILSFTAGENCDSVNLVADVANSSRGQYDKNGEWIIQVSEVLSQCLDGKPNVKFVLKLDRMPSFTLLNTVIPVNIISSLSSLAFLMPVGSGERVSFSVTVLLSLTVYTSEISKELPTNSESMPLLIMYLASLLLHSAFCIVANLIVLIQRYHHLETNALKKEQNEHSSGMSFSHPFATDDSFLSTIKSHGVCLLKVRTSAFDINNHEPTTNTSVDDSSFDKCCKFKTNFEDCRGNLPFHKKHTNNHKEGNGKFYLLRALVSGVLKYFRLVDIILFILFFGIWFFVTLVFMTLIANGDP
ncbi:unnamed protein product [Candidula unifasciata]|uniref:Uncharacterized protein n=1 Tax=Candidula unifasciata TaxID=100452 RepID=A0A8S3ZZT6_9EUPU|nr:unnamed protein product [Candidula unifasciata]